MRRSLMAGFITGLTLNIGEALLHGSVLREAANAAYRGGSVFENLAFTPGIPVCVILAISVRDASGPRKG